VREAAADGSSVVYGDAGRKEALAAAGLARARAVVVTFAKVAVALRILHHVRDARPELPVIVRTLDDTQLDRLLDAGAAEVVPEVLEGSLMLATHSLLHSVCRSIACSREFARFAKSATVCFADSSTARPTMPTQPKTSSRDCTRCICRTARMRSARRSARSHLATLVEVTGVRRKGARSLRPGPDWVFESGDVVVLLGRPADLGVAEQRLLDG
jgi:CPA2 family monovalent cation:H+ antiporter-2